MYGPAPHLIRDIQSTKLEPCETCSPHSWHGAPCLGCGCMGPFVGVPDAWLPVKDAN